MLGQRHLGVLLVVRPDPVDGELDLRPAAERIERLAQGITGLGRTTSRQLQIKEEFVESGEFVNLRGGRGSKCSNMNKIFLSLLPDPRYSPLYDVTLG